MKTRKRIAFDLQAAIAKAWEFCWADNLDCRTKGYGITRSAYTFLTASDLEQRIRAHAAEVMDDVEYGKYGRSHYGRGVTVRGAGRGGLLGDIRNWLSREVNAGRIRFDRNGTGCTAQRFRPAGEELSEAEVETAKKKAEKEAKGPTVHLRRISKFGYTEHCRAEQRAAAKAKGKITYAYGRRRQPLRSTIELDKVTCPSCLKAIREMQAELAELEGRGTQVLGTPDADRIALLRQRLHLDRINDTEEIV